MIPLDPLDREILEKVLEAAFDQFKVSMGIHSDRDEHLELELRRELMEIAISNGVGDVDTLRQLLMARMTDQETDLASTA